MSGKNLEGRCITIARVRARMTTKELAERLYYSTAYVAQWERGERPPHWEELYAVLPELPEIREKGCAAYCPKSKLCKFAGKCLIATASKWKGYLTPDYVNVIRCKDCLRGGLSKVHGRTVVRCPYMERCMEPDGYCCYGERREGND